MFYTRFRAANELARDEVHLLGALFPWSCLTLLASPNSIGGGLGRARVVPLRGVLFRFSFFVKIIVPKTLVSTFVRVDAYQSTAALNISSEIYCRYHSPAGSSDFLCINSTIEVEGSNPGKKARVLFFFFRGPFFFFTFIYEYRCGCHRVVSLPSTYVALGPDFFDFFL